MPWQVWLSLSNFSLDELSSKSEGLSGYGYSLYLV